MVGRADSAGVSGVKGLDEALGNVLERRRKMAFGSGTGVRFTQPSPVWRLGRWVWFLPALKEPPPASGPACVPTPPPPSPILRTSV